MPDSDGQSYNYHCKCALLQACGVKGSYFKAPYTPLYQ